MVNKYMVSVNMFFRGCIDCPPDKVDAINQRIREHERTSDVKMILIEEDIDG